MFLICFSSLRKINSDTLEIVEHSLDINLTSNKVRYRFVDAPILDGISIHETYENVIILVPTVCSVHKLTFPHPDCFYKQVSDLYGDSFVFLNCISFTNNTVYTTYLYVLKIF